MLVILDGHKSHVSVGLTEWAQELGIVIFILPPHCSHILQPMDVGCFGPLQRIYDNKCHKLIRELSSVITRYNVCEVACSAYTAALTPGNIQGAFRRAGIHPFNPQAIPHEKLLPAEVFRPLAESDTETVDSQATVEGGITEGIDKTMDMFSEKERTLRKAKSEHKVKPRNTMSKIVAGKEIDERVLEK